MTGTDPRSAHAILRRVIDLPPAARSAAVSRESGGDGSLADRVHALLRAADASEGFLEAMPIALAAGAVAGMAAAVAAEAAEAAEATVSESAPGDGTAGDRPSDDSRASPAAVPKMIDGYRIQRLIGDGGMASVYLALQSQPPRPVAIKIMKRGLGRASAVRRFQFETAVLARLRHPGIAPIHESGVYHDDDGVARPWFAMEYIEGAVPITTAVRQRGLDRRARIALLAEVCDAVQHGHQLGVAHCDLKPANVLVGPDGRARIIDFGIARSLGSGPAAGDQGQWGSPPGAEAGGRRDAGTSRDTEWTSLAGSLSAMSPEQATPGGGPVDARTDVHGLGGLLYQLLLDRRPHDVAGLPLEEALRVVREQPPPTPRSVDRSISRDLDAIVRKAMAMDPDDRYRSAGGLATDLRRLLRHETVEARRGSVAEQAMLFARRHRPTAVAAAASALVLAGSAVVSVLAAERARDESRRRAVAERVAVGERDEARWQAYVASISDAVAALEDGEFRRMRMRLASTDPPLRGWEWGMLSIRAEPSCRVLATQDGGVLAAEPSPDGTRIVTAGRDGRVRVWDLSTGDAVAEATPHDGPAWSVSFTPDGRRILSAGRDRQVRASDAATGVVQWTRSLPRTPRGVSESADGRVVALDGEGRVTAWFPGTGEAPIELPAPVEQRVGVRLMGVGEAERLFSWGTGGMLEFRAPAAAAPGRSLVLGRNVEAAAVSPAGDRIAAGGVGGLVAVWDEDDAEPRWRVEGPPSAVSAVAFSRDGTMLAVGHVDRSIEVRRVDTGERLHALRGHEDSITGLAWTDDGRLHSTSMDGTIRTWELDARPGVQVRSGSPSLLGDLAWRPGGPVVVTGGADGVLRTWSPLSGAPGPVRRGSLARLLAVATSRDGRWTATGGADGTVRVHEGEWEGAALELAVGEGAQVIDVAVAPDGDGIVAATNDGRLVRWPLPPSTGEPPVVWREPAVLTMALSPDGRLLATGGRDGDVHLRDARSGRELATLSGHDRPVLALAFAPDGSRLFSGGTGATVRAWSVAAALSGGDPAIGSLDAVGQVVSCLATHPDGTRVLAGSWYGDILVWDVGRAALVASFNAHGEPVRALAFDPSGRWLASASHDGTVRFHDGGAAPSAAPVRPR